MSFLLFSALQGTVIAAVITLQIAGNIRAHTKNDRKFASLALPAFHFVLKDCVGLTGLAFQEEHVHKRFIERKYAKSQQLTV